MSKKPLKEYYVIREERKIENEVFDKDTLRIVSKLIKKGIISTLDYPVSTGKEANLFRAKTEDGQYLAVKIYKLETSPFFRRMDYIEADPRFKKIKKTNKEIAVVFARKEYSNLKICEAAKVHSPNPYYVEKNILVMSFLGEDGLPYPTLNMVGPRNIKDLESILIDIKKMYRAGLVHADISEYNIMLGNYPYLIDFGQAVVTKHINAEKFLERDVRNILSYFEKKGYSKDFNKIIKWIRN